MGWYMGALTLRIVFYIYIYFFFFFWGGGEFRIDMLKKQKEAYLRTVQASIFRCSGLGLRG